MVHPSIPLTAESDGDPTQVEFAGVKRVNVAQAMLDPARFFLESSLQASAKCRTILMFVIGLGSRVDSLMEKFPPFLLARDQWSAFFLALLTGTATHGLFRVYVGGFWFRARLRFCGVALPCGAEARLINALSDLPLLGFTAIVWLPPLLMHETPWRAFRAPIPWPAGVGSLFGLAWGIYMNFEAARVRFGVSRRKRFFWFAVVPLVLNVVLVSGVMAWNR